MFFNLLYIHLFRPFLKYNPSNSPLPSHVSPRKLCTQAAGSVSKLMRLYKRTYGLRQICNIAVYIVHSACTIHLLNLPEKTAKRDIIHGVKHLEEIAEDWLCARRTLSILSVLARKWKIDLPEEASVVFARTDAKYGFFSTNDVPSPKQELVVATPSPPPIDTSPSHLQALPPTQSHIRSQNQLQRSLYSYSPDPRIMRQNPNSLSPQGSAIQMSKPTSSAGIGSMTLPNDQILPTVPYPQYSSNMSHPPVTPNSEISRANSSTLTETARQVSPNTMFGGVDALVESQDWWLRDQASLAVGFENWMSVTNGDLSNSANGLNGVVRHGSNPGLDSVDPLTGAGTAFYVQQNGNSLSDTYDDDWTYT
jgi:hypothetical protein